MAVFRFNHLTGESSAMKMLKNKKILIGVVIALLVLSVETVLAAYTGPVGRSTSVTYWERKNCHYQAVYNPPGP